MVTSPDPRLRNFPPVQDRRARVLVLGSMPGPASLEAQQYYAHPRNAFWPLIESLFGIAADLDYEARLRGLGALGIALWDSAHRCRRQASADATIQDVEPSDFGWLFGEAPGIRALFFNGRKAEELFMRHALPRLSPEHAALPRYSLPSTSPAHASLRFEDKLAAWQVLREVLEGTQG